MIHDPKEALEYLGRISHASASLEAKDAEIAETAARLRTLKKERKKLAAERDKLVGGINETLPLLDKPAAHVDPAEFKTQPLRPGGPWTEPESVHSADDTRADFAARARVEAGQPTGEDWASVTLNHVLPSDDARSRDIMADLNLGHQIVSLGGLAEWIRAEREIEDLHLDAKQLGILRYALHRYREGHKDNTALLDAIPATWIGYGGRDFLKDAMAKDAENRAGAEAKPKRMRKPKAKARARA